MRQEYLQTVFNMFDTDESGKINSVEIFKLLGTVNMSDMPTEEQIKEYITEIDIDGDGEINFHEFCMMMQHCQTRDL